MLTIPMLDWVARIGNNRSKLASFSIAKYGAQTGNDWQWYPDAGNGILASTGQSGIRLIAMSVRPVPRWTISWTR
jgi:hypothetical protein